MKTDFGRFVAGVALAAATFGSTVLGQNFSYQEDFNLLADGSKPPGWSTLNSTGNAAFDPQILSADPASWATQCTYDENGNINNAPCGGLGVLQDYNTWSGGKRFNLIHPGQDLGGKVAVAWYSGDAGPHTGDYPLPMRNGKLRVEFDCIQRTGAVPQFCRDTHPPTGLADGGIFALLPVTNPATDISSRGLGGGGIGWASLVGMAVEFDTWPNAADPTGDDRFNHIGLDSFLTWANAGGNDQSLESIVTHLDPPLSLPVGFLPRFEAAGDNNQPLHITLYYNDPEHTGPEILPDSSPNPLFGQLGVVAVYLKVDPATADDPGTAISFGLETGEPEGVLTLLACVGEWPVEQAILGFTASTGACNQVYQVDNINVELVPVAGSFCTPTGLPDFNPGPLVELTASPVGECVETDLTEQGWDVKTYWRYGDLGLTRFKENIAFDEANNLAIASEHAVPDINYNDSDCPGIIPGDRSFPGMPLDNFDGFGMVAKGWICFPPGDDYPRDYALNIRSDDQFELIIGNQTVASFPLDPADASGRGCATVDTWSFPDPNDPTAVPGTSFNLRVSAAGVYPINLLWTEGGGGAGIEFARRFPVDSLLLRPSDTLVGPANALFADQPVVWSRYQSQEAPDLYEAQPPAGNPSPLVTLAASEKVSGGPAGDSGLTIKIVKAPFGTPPPTSDFLNNNGIGIFANRGDAGDWSMRQFLDAMDPIVPMAVSPVVNFRGSDTQGQGYVPGKVLPPGLGPYASGAGLDQYGIRAEGFITFPGAGIYALTAHVDDDLFIYIGRQVIWSRGCCGGQVFFLEVTDPGTYPIRIEGGEGGGDDRFEFGHSIFPIGLTAVNGPGSNIMLTTEATSGPYEWAPFGTVIPADRKVAEVGEAANAGWNVTLVKAPTAPVAIEVNSVGVGTTLIENELLTLGSGFIPPEMRGADQVGVLNYADVGEDGGRYHEATTPPGPADRRYTDFATFLNPAGGNDDFAVSAQGYIEFLAPGTYSVSTRADDGVVVWIGGKIVNRFPGGGQGENSVGNVVIEAAGLYPIRIDNYERVGGAALEFFQYLPDRSVVLVNDPASTFTVYRDLTVTPDATGARFLHPLKLAAGSAAAPINRGQDPGIHVDVVDPIFNNGDHPLAGNDKLRHIRQASGHLDAHLVLGNPLLRPGNLTSGNVDTLEGTSGFLGVGGDDFVVRATGYLALEAGAHLFGVASDDGFDFWLGGTDPRVDGWHIMQSHSLKGEDNIRAWVYVPEDGLYRFTIDYMERGSGEQLTFTETVWDGVELVTEPINGGTTGLTARAYVNLNPCPIPFADNDRDGDVDSTDFAAWQNCYDPVGVQPLPEECACFDTNANGRVDQDDFLEFDACGTGPDVPWSQESTPNCTP